MEGNTLVHRKANIMTVALIAAAGSGKRMGAGRNKVFLPIHDAPILVHTLRGLARSEKINSFIIIAAENETDEIKERLRQEKLPPFKIVVGGSERQYSIENGLKALPKDADIVLVHDAARPFVSVKTIEGVIDAAKKYGAAISAFPEKNTIKEVENGVITGTPKREKLWAATTPQGFSKDVLLKAYQKAREDNYLGTDDASLVERIGVAVHIVEDSYDNFKITTPNDLKMAEYMLTSR